MIELPEPMSTPNTNRPLLPPPVLEAALRIWGQAGRKHLVPIAGRSMLPFIQDGDRVLVAHGCADVRRGDVIVFRRGGRLIAHRVLRIHRRQSEPIFITKGDNIRRFDPPVSPSEVIGRVVAVERGDRQMALDTAAWRAVGWLIAVSTLAWIKLYDWGRGLERRLRSFRGRRFMPKPSARAPAAGTRPEIDLLLCCARTCMDPANAERIRGLLREDVDWAYLLRTARRHGVMPLLYRSLRTTCPGTVPQAALAQFRDHFHANARRNVLLTKELLKLLNLFEAHGIPALPLKGPALAASVYGDPSLRQFGDLDILVHQRDVPRARDLLASRGYRLWKQGRRIGAQQAASLQVRHHYQFVSDDGGVAVELHWRIARRHFSFPLAPEHLWEHLEPVSLAGRTAPNLPPEDLLLILCVHGAKPWHRWGRLGWICDVAELIRVRPGLDWGRVMAQARRLGSERRLLLGLCLAGDLLGAALPEEVRHRMQADPIVEPLAAQVRKWLPREGDGRPGVLARFLFDLQVMERWQDRARSCLLSALTSTVVKWALRPPTGLLRFPYSLLERVPSRNVWIWPLPLFALLSFLYHLLRPIRQVARYGLSRLKTLTQISTPARVRCAWRRRGPEP